MLGMFRSLWLYRHFVLSSIKNDLISRFSRSKIGGLWMIVNPLVQVAIYAFVLSNVLAAKLPDTESQYAYAVYLMAGLLAWTLFSEIIGRCLNLFIEQGNLMKKVQFPRVTLPVIVVGSNLLNYGLLLLSILAIFFVLDHSFSIEMFWLLPLTFILTCFALGVGLVLGVMNVFLRDLTHVVPIILQVLFWLTPIVYPVNIIPAEYHHWLSVNPLYHFTASYQDVLVYGRSPEIGGVLYVGLFSLLLLVFSLFLFRRSAEEMVDVL